MTFEGQKRESLKGCSKIVGRLQYTACTIEIFRHQESEIDTMCIIISLIFMQLASLDAQWLICKVVNPLSGKGELVVFKRNAHEHCVSFS
jgi:spore maturation protein SpmB